MDRKQEWKRCLAVIISFLAIAGSGCGSIISKTARQQAYPPVSYAELQANPEAFKDRMIILGGTVLNCRTEDDMMSLEVLQYPLGRSEKPDVTEEPEGLFLLRCDRDLNPAVCAHGRLITVAGRVVGAGTGRTGDQTYTYPLLACQEIHLWAPRVSSPKPYDPGPWRYRDPLLYPRYEDDAWDW